MIPLVQVSSDPETIQKHADDLDVLLEENLSSWAERMLETVAAVASRAYTPGCSRRATPTSGSPGASWASRCSRQAAIHRKTVRKGGRHPRAERRRIFREPAYTGRIATVFQAE
jgi:hypothetical protein